MFSGIVEETGTVESAERRSDVLVVRIRAGRSLEGLGEGSSIAVSGCCLTAISVRDGGFTCELTEETLRRTAFGDRLVPGRLVNLERSLRADGRFDGHIVQGHVDETGVVRELRREASDTRLTLSASRSFTDWLVEKGSVAVDGVALTVVSLSATGFDVALIPHTLEVTTLGGLAPGALVNLEADVLGKYVRRYLARVGAAPPATSGGA
jgi:riboflavin synthase